ncbi:hypothetical protein BASA50_004651 [Batrachochytrium salamandrivorans]|uniref:Extracellular metalloproteinase n=1 Tax=Batrachochytrium salamandrivorans TaxID=1357716 RepID=A0ABQ8FHX7_9FUNG|nr:hypothetical protein BASA50_004651 [Batrachochytrium salamandrivorans]
MVAVSFILILALVSSTVVAQPKTNGFTSPFACLKPLETSEISTKSVYEWIPLSKRTLKSTSDEDSVEIGLSYLLQQLNLQSNEFRVKTSFTDNLGITHLYGIPLHKGLKIGNLHAAAHIKYSQVFFYSATTIVDDHALTKRSPTIPESTIKILSEDAVKAAVDCLGVPFYHDIAPVMESYWTSDGNILVWVFQLRDDPITQWFEVKSIQKTFNHLRMGGLRVLKTIGNNAEAKYKKRKTFGTSIRGMFDMDFDPIPPPQISKNLIAGAVNAFYVHELTHGLSDRLTGGAQTKMCMSKIESGGLSEGYSDMIVLIFTAKPKDTRNTRRVMGEYVEGDQRGSRRYPYTTDIRVNPLKYRDAVGEKQRHALGEIWATMLWEVYWNLVEKYGFSANLHDATQKEGNIIFLQILVGTLMIQPCNPTFESAHDAMLAADDAYYGGVHKHLITKGFAKRGLGSIS